MNLLQNVRVKLFLQNTIFIVLTWINRFLPHSKKVILLYINTDLRESNKALLDYMLENNYNESYRIICSCNNPKDYINGRNVYYVNRLGGVKAFFRAGSVFYSIGKIPIIPGRGQTVIQMWHGTPLKGASEGWKKNHIWKRQHYTWLLSPSRHFVPIFSQLFSVPKERIFIGGYPRCDDLFKSNPHYDFGEYRKIILWAPTFRKSIDTGISEFLRNGTIIPILKRNDYITFNAFLASIGVKIVVKLHPYQCLEGEDFAQMDYLILLSHHEFLSRKMNLYRFAVQSDALITDYSSIYFDYLLLDRPIAFTEDDIDEYNNTRGFAVEDPGNYKPGVRMKTMEDLKMFCENLIHEKDDYKAERERVKKLSNDYCDGHFCERILNKMEITK
ncbi:CDP-glycerol glycerophosphotransferase family protein [Phocaeicola sartorii]|uniref:CDP-glycerol glycerophosphotransferase family protein n=1 Tax=Phocaeicola sartorii TaxID=671267 RepID=UPI0035161B63